MIDFFHHARRFTLLAFALALLSVSGASLAQRSPDENGLDQAVRSVEQRTGGQVLSADRRRVDGQPKYRIKVLSPSGRVRIIYIDAR